MRRKRAGSADVERNESFSESQRYPGYFGHPKVFTLYSPALVSGVSLYLFLFEVPWFLAFFLTSGFLSFLFLGDAWVFIELATQPPRVRL
jgi:hypothetical protein